MKGIERIVEETITEYRLIKPSDKVILGVSGGPDSICMFHLFLKFQQKYKLKIVCAHFNHSLRKEADEEEVFVRSLCDKHNVRFISQKRDVRKFFNGDSLEQAARKLRFDFFLFCSRHFHIKKIALAHNRDDVVETVLMNILRGTALRGLRGILPLSRWRGVRIIRPLIRVRKIDIINWFNKNKLEYRIDKSNFDERFLRNRIRHKLIPILEEYNPNVVEAIANLATLVGWDYEFIYRFSLKTFDQIKKVVGKSLLLDLAKIKELPFAVQLEVIRIAIEEVKGDLRKLEWRHFKEILDCIHNRPRGSIVHLPDVELEKEEGTIVIKSLIL